MCYIRVIIFNTALLIYIKVKLETIINFKIYYKKTKSKEDKE